LNDHDQPLATVRVSSWPTDAKPGHPNTRLLNDCYFLLVFAPSCFRFQAFRQILNVSPAVIAKLGPLVHSAATRPFTVTSCNPFQAT
jgi:hypothetical protein